MKHTILFLLLLIVFSSCKKEFAYFQKSNYSSFHTKKESIKLETPNPILETPLIAAANEDFSSIFQQNEEIQVNNINPQIKNEVKDNGRKKKKRNIKQNNGTFLEKLFPNNDHKNTKQTQKKRKPVPLNSTIYTGFIILGIAILLALVSLNSLSLLFGLASIIFLYIGFKTFFRKKRRRDMFR